MKTEKFKIKLMSEDSTAGRAEAFEKVCCFLLQKYYGGCEKFECLGIFESVNGGTSRERLFYAGPEDGRYE